MIRKHDCDSRIHTHRAFWEMVVVVVHKNYNGKRVVQQCHSTTLWVDRQVPHLSQRWTCLVARQNPSPRWAGQHYQSIVDMHHQHPFGVSHLHPADITLQLQGRTIRHEFGLPIIRHRFVYYAVMLAPVLIA